MPISKRVSPEPSRIRPSSKVCSDSTLDSEGSKNCSYTSEEKDVDATLCVSGEKKKERERASFGEE